MKAKINKLLCSNKFTFLISLIFSFCIWIKLSTSSSERISKTITNIPIVVNLSESAKEAGLTIFGLDNIKAEVTVSGNRITLGQLTKDNITVFAQQSAGIINSTGNYTLELCAKKNGRITNYEILDNVSPRLVNVFVDRLQSKNFKIDQNINCKTDAEHVITAAVLSEPEITISGPETVVSSISKVTVEKEIGNVLTESTSMKSLPLNLYDENGKKVATNNLSFSVNSVNATVNVFAKKTVDVVPVFLNKPKNLTLNKARVSLSHSKIEIAASKEVLDSIDSVQLESLDLSDINLNNKEFNLNVKMPNSVINLSNLHSVNLRINTDGIQEKQIKVNNIYFVNVPPGKDAVSFAKSITVNLLGPYNELRNIKPEFLCAEIDLSQKENFKGIIDIPVSVKTTLPSSCWVHGRYSVMVQIS